VTLIMVVLAGSSAMAQSQAQFGDTPVGLPGARPKHKPIDLEIDAPSLDFMQDITKVLNDIHDEYRGYKKELRRDYDLHYSMQVSIIPQWGAPNGGPGVVQMVYTPNIIWSPFKDTAVGSGLLTYTMQQTQFWTKTITASQQARLGLITPPNDQTTNVRQFNQLMYTHTLPDAWSWLSVTVGQYTFAAYDSNQYAGDVQTNFISYPLAQNATQTYPYGALGAYAQATTPDQQFSLASGFQGATNVTGDRLTARGFSTGKYAYFVAGEWAPNLLGGGTYDIIGYSQPSVPQQPSNSLGVSFSAVQNIDAKWGLFLRANGASGTAIPIETSVAWGGIYTDPFHRNKLDQVGLGIFWDKTNLKAVGQPARNAEWGAELYYSYTVFKGLRLTPDIQLYLDPALKPGAGPAAVFTIRTTAFF
jgi:Carbohydrate-selective porin, OprB family